MKPARTPAPARRRWDWRRVFGGLAELLRNIALVAVGTPSLWLGVSGGVAYLRSRAERLRWTVSFT